MNDNRCCDKSEERAGKPPWSIDRQVRLVSGTLVLLGLALAYSINPVFILLSLVVALGMIVSACTDSCAMGIVVSYLPWNRGRCQTNESEGKSVIARSSGD